MSLRKTQRGSVLLHRSHFLTGVSSARGVALGNEMPGLTWTTSGAAFTSGGQVTHGLFPLCGVICSTPEERSSTRPAPEEGEVGPSWLDDDPHGA